MPTTYRKEVLTTGDVARMCHVAPRTVSKWVDTGKLRGYRIPGSRDRRVPLANLLAFMRTHGIPLDGMDGGACRVLIIEGEAGAGWLAEIRRDGRYEVRTAANGFEAGVAAQQFRPHVIVLDVSGQKEEDAAAVCRNIKSSGDFLAAKVIAAASRDGKPAEWFAASGFDDCLFKPFGAAELAAAVQRATNLIT
ncbi:MAG: helix-turn-helix domain-containing protein [Phycisphaerae bacterium]